MYISNLKLNINEWSDSIRIMSINPTC